MKKIPVLSAILLALPGLAAASDPAGYWNERQELSSRYRAPLDIAVFPGTASSPDPHVVTGRFLPATNYLTKATGSLVSIIPEPRATAFRQRLASGRYDLIYVTPELGVTALKNGYEPLVQRNLPIKGIAIVPAASPVKSLEELAGKKVAAISGSLMEGMLRHYAATHGGKIQVSGIKVINQPDLAISLDSGSADAAIMRGEFAEKLAAGGKYRIVGNVGSVPGFLLMAKKGAVEEGRRLASAMMTIDKSPDRIAMLQGMDGVKSDTHIAFLPASAADLDETARMLEAVQKATGNQMIIEGKGAAK